MYFHVGAVCWMGFFLATTVSQSSLTPQDPVSAPDALLSVVLHNRLQCQRLCWYTATCVRYSYYNRPAVSAPGGSDPNCVLHAAAASGQDLEDGWEHSPASGADMPDDHGCHARHCGEDSLCVPVISRDVTHFCTQLPDMNDCASLPCLNGGTCTDGVKAYTCDCAAGYDGDRCQTTLIPDWLDTACSADSDCPLDGSECFKDKTCLCSPGKYYSVGNKTCLADCPLADLRGGFLRYEFSYGGGPSLWQSFDTSLSECKDKCLRDVVNCRSFNYKAGVQYCILRSVVRSSGVPYYDNSPSYDYYQRTCA